MNQQPDRSEVDPAAVVSFWLDAGPDRWFKKDQAFDAEIARKFGSIAEAAARGELDHWAQTTAGMLALILVLDQFRRNIHRDSAEAFKADPKALALAETAIGRGDDLALPPAQRKWIYLPLEHTEDLAVQERCVALFEALDHDDLVKWAVLHRDIIARFGRFPHRNKVLGRETTPEEAEFLAEGGFAG